METSWLEAPVAGEGKEVENNGITYTIVGTSPTLIMSGGYRMMSCIGFLTLCRTT